MNCRDFYDYPTYTPDTSQGLHSGDFKKSVCTFLGGMLALGASLSDKPDHYIKIGANIANTCHESYDRTGE